MNNKLLKKLRAGIRKFLGSMSVRDLNQPVMMRMVPDYAAGLNLTGLPKMVPFAFPLPATNKPNSQRGVYRRAKALAKAEAKSPR